MDNDYRRFYVHNVHDDWQEVISYVVWDKQLEVAVVSSPSRILALQIAAWLEGGNIEHCVLSERRSD